MESTTLYSLLKVMSNQLSFEEMRLLTFDLGIDFDEIQGESKQAKARELIAFLERRGRIDELLGALRRSRPDLKLESDVEPESLKNASSASDADLLTIELSSLRQQLDEIRSGALTDKQLEKKVDGMLKTATLAIGRSEELTARVLLPPSELTDVQLLPAGALDRLEEYRSDENIAFLLVGAFGGAILGILSNWATNENFAITRISLVLLGLFIILCALCIFWAWHIRQRVSSVKGKILAATMSNKEADE